MRNTCLPLLLICTMWCAGAFAQAQQTKEILRKTKIDRFVTSSVDELLDTLSKEYHIPVYFNRELMSQLMVSNRFFNESLQDVLKFVCRNQGLRYWIENDGTLYMMQNPDDLPNLRIAHQLQKNAGAIKPKPLPPPAFAPKHFGFALTGRVTDQNTGEALPGASVKIRFTDLNAMTNVEGKFAILNVPSDTVSVEVSFVGYQPDVFRLTSKSVDSALVLSLYPTMNALSEVSVTDKKSGVLNTDTKKVSVLQLNPTALDKLPNIGERDIMRAFQLMPGVSATNESSSGAYVRGGTPDQNLVLFDGITVYQVDHLYGFFSAFNSNAVRDVDLYKGGFSSKYGGRLSSVTDIHGKDGNRNETNFGGDLSLLSTNIYAESPVGKNSSALIAFRRSYQGPFYDKIFGQFNTAVASGAPAGGGGGFGGRGGGFGGGFNRTTPSSYFYDLNAKYTYTVNPHNTLSFSFFNGQDYLDNSRDMTIPAFSATSNASDLKVNDNGNTGNTGASLRWTSTIGPKLFANTTFSYSGFFSDRDRSTVGTISDSSTVRNINNGTVEHNRLHDLSFKTDWEWQTASKFKLDYGAFGSQLNVKYQYIQNDTTQLINQNNNGFTGGGYAELEIDPTSKLHIQPGARLTYFSPTGKLYTEPRLSLTYHLTDKINLKGATGRFYQYTNQVTREDVTGGDRNFWVLANNSNIPVGSANHYILGANYETKNFLFDVEAYYKTLNGLTEYSIRQTGFGGGIPFATNTGEPTVTQDFYNGQGYAKGIEFLAQKKAGLYTGWISYTLSQAKEKFAAYGDTWFSSPQDITHELKSINMYHLQRWSFAAVFIFSTGHPYTAPESVYTLSTLDGRNISYLTISAKNGERLPDYHRLDLSATYDFLKLDGRKVGSIGLSLFNVYNHVNSWYNEYFIRDSQVVTTNVKYLGFTPNITFSMRWK